MSWISLFFCLTEAAYHCLNPRFSDKMTIALLIQNARLYIFILLHFRIFHNWTLQLLYVSLKKNI